MGKGSRVFEAKWCLKWDIFRLLNFTVSDFYFISTALGGTRKMVPESLLRNVVFEKLNVKAGSFRGSQRGKE